jgi:hypothetical protein
MILAAERAQPFSGSVPTGALSSADVALSAWAQGGAPAAFLRVLAEKLLDALT